MHDYETRSENKSQAPNLEIRRVGPKWKEEPFTSKNYSSTSLHHSLRKRKLDNSHCRRRGCTLNGVKRVPHPPLHKAPVGPYIGRNVATVLYRLSIRQNSISNHHHHPVTPQSACVILRHSAFTVVVAFIIRGIPFPSYLPPRGLHIPLSSPDETGIR